MDRSKALSLQSWTTAFWLLLFVGGLGKVIGMLREMLIARCLGIQPEADAFVIAVSLIGVTTTFGVAFSIALIPHYQQVILHKGSLRAQQFLGTTLLLVVGCSTLCCLLLFLAADSLVRVIAPGLTEDTVKLTINLTRHFGAYIFYLNIFYVLISIYQASHHFKLPAISELFFNLCLIGMLVLFATPGNTSVIIKSYTLSILFVVCCLLIIAIKFSLLKFSVTHDELKEYIWLTYPILIFELVKEIRPLIQNYFASSLPVGTIAALSYSCKVIDAISVLVGMSIAKGIFPTISASFANHAIQETKDLFFKLVNKLVFFLIPCTTLLIFFRKEMLIFFFKGGIFNDEAILLTSKMCFFYGITLPINTLNLIFLRFFYAFRNSKTPLISILVSLCLSTPLYYLLIPCLEGVGIVLTSVILSVIQLLYMTFSLYPKLDKAYFRKVGHTLFLSTIFTCAASPILIYSRDVTSSNYWALVLIIILFSCIYLVLSVLFYPRELKLYLLGQNELNLPIPIAK